METSIPLARQIPRELFERSLTISLWGAVRTWLVVVLTWWTVGTLGTWWSLPFAIALIGTMQYHLNVLGHDGLHFLLSNRRVANDLICRWLLHGPQGAPLGSMRRNHLNHHSHFGAPSDLDRQYYDLRRFATAVDFRVWLAGTMMGGMTLPIIVKLARPRQQPDGPVPVQTPRQGRRDWLLDWASVIASQGWIALAAWSLTGWWYAWLLLWVVPMLTVMMGLNSVRSCLEHANLGGDAPALNTFVSNRVESFFLAPFNMNIHAEHHLVPAVPWHHLPALRHYISGRGLTPEVKQFRSYRTCYAWLCRNLPVPSRWDPR